MKIRERWSYKFELITDDRTYLLYTVSEDEKYLWVHTFKWIIE
jgi:hypothetical protein